ncbi:MAG: 50S ribosomal protein L21 [Victivallaceae bacterium]
MSTYAIIKTGGKQYKVQEGDVIDVELLKVEDKQELVFEEVLFFSDGDSFVVGKPCVDRVSVKAVVLGEVRGEKVVAYKYKRRKNYHRKVGHRQNSTRVKIVGISL